MHSRLDKLEAKAAGIPKSLRGYCKRYGSSVSEIIQIRLQNGEGNRVGERKDKVAA